MSFAVRVNRGVWACVGNKAPCLYRTLRGFVRDAINWRARILLPHPRYQEPVVGVKQCWEYIEFTFYILDWEEFDEEDRQSFVRAVRLHIASQLWTLTEKQIGEGSLPLKFLVFRAVRET